MTLRFHKSFPSACLHRTLVACAIAVSATAFVSGVIGQASAAEPVLLAQAPSDYGPEWTDTLAKAKKEGTVSVALGSGPLRETRQVWGVFESKYGVKVVTSGGTGASVTKRILAERAAGRSEVDLVIIGTASVLTELVPNNLVAPIEPLLFLPEVRDNAIWWEGKRWYADPEQKYLIMYALSPSDSGIGINTKLVNEDDINSFWDVLDPKYDGKRVSGTMSVAQGANSLADMVAMVGGDWLERWIRSKPIFVADSDIGINYLVERRAALGMFLSGELQGLDTLAEKGAPVKRITKPMKEGIRVGRGSSGFGAMVNPPHPNAQKLLINWLMAKEGQIALQNSYERYNSPREDIPKDMLAPDVQRIPGARYVMLSQDPNYNALFKQAMDIVKKTQAETK